MHSRASGPSLVEAYSLEAHCQVTLVVRTSGSCFAIRSLRYPQRRRVRLPRLLALAEGAVQVADLFVGDGEVALVVGAVGLGLGETLGDREVAEVVRGGLLPLAEVAVQVADLLMETERSRW